jgi:hypothetical protein
MAPIKQIETFIPMIISALPNSRLTRCLAALDVYSHFTRNAADLKFRNFPSATGQTACDRGLDGIIQRKNNFHDPTL